MSFYSMAWLHSLFHLGSWIVIFIFILIFLEEEVSNLLPLVADHFQVCPNLLYTHAHRVFGWVRWWLLACHFFCEEGNLFQLATNYTSLGWLANGGTQAQSLATAGGSWVVSYRVSSSHLETLLTIRATSTSALATTGRLLFGWQFCVQLGPTTIRCTKIMSRVIFFS